MEIKIPKITKPLDLGEYAEKMRGQVIHVWVNPPIAVRDERRSVNQRMQELKNRAAEIRSAENKNEAEEKQIDQEAQELLQKQYEMIAEMWSQGPDVTHYTAEEIKKFYEESLDTDPELVPWMVRRSGEMTAEHQGRIKKK